MKKTILKILVFILFIACNPLKYASTLNDSAIKINIKGGDSVQAGDQILFSVENTYYDSILIFKPERLFIEKFEENSWRKLKIPECLCDVPCQPSAETMKLQPGEFLEITWDQNERWCGPRIGNQVRETIFEAAGAGQYRIIINFRYANGDESSFSQQFFIVN